MKKRKSSGEDTKRRKSYEAAARIASDQIDQLEDSSASAEEKVRRKKHLLKGPEEFRSSRDDQRKR